MIKLFRRRADGGAAVLEFAIAAPILIYLLIGLVDVGRYMYFGIVAAHGARAGAQYGAQSVQTAQDTVGITNAVVKDADAVPGITVATPVISCQGSSGTPGQCTQNGTMTAGAIYYITVNVSGTFTPLVMYPGIPSSVPITATTTMRLGFQ